LTKLEKVLKEKGIKQTWLADKIGKSPAGLNRWVKGRRTPSYNIKCRISEALGIPVDGLFFNDNVKVNTNDNPKTVNTS
jgi:repressor LexA